MTELFIKIYRYFRGHKAVYWFSMAFLLIFFGYFATRIHLEEDINKLMPSSKNEDGTTKLAFADLKIKDKVFLLFEDKAGNLDSLIQTCDEFVEELTQKDSVTQTIGDIFYKLDEDLMADGIDYLSEHLPAYIDTTAYIHFDSLLTREHFTQQMQQKRT